MSDFYHGRFQILVCTTIIETGIDIPNANTIIINNAQNFGLAQFKTLMHIAKIGVRDDTRDACINVNCMINGVVYVDFTTINTEYQ
jgi:late competence protein required for DNA uptake (superfamily II DNA/RNA helicase)